MLAVLGAEVELRAARVALANLGSGGTASPPRSPVRVGGAPRRAAPLYISGAVRQPTSRHGSVRARASKDTLCSRTCGDGPSRGFQDGQHRHGAAEELESAAIGGHVLMGAGARAEDVAQFIVSPAEPGG